MPLFYPIVIRHVLHRVRERCHLIDLRHSLTTMCLFLLLSFFTLFIKTSPSSSSSLSLLPSSHIFFPPDLTSLQCSPQKNHELQAHYPQQESINSERKYTKDQSKQKNVSRGKILFLIIIKNSIIFFVRSSTRSRNFTSFSTSFN
jgi:hypothetical protein